MSNSSGETGFYTTNFGRKSKPGDIFTFPPGHGDNMAPAMTYKRHEKERQKFLAQLKNRCLPEVWETIETTDKNLNNQLEKYNEMNTVQLIDKLNKLNDQLGKLKVNNGGQKGGMINEDEDEDEDISLLESIALIMSFANITEQALEGASEIMNKVLDMSVRIVDIISNNEGCLQDYLNMVLGNTLTQLLQGTLFIQILMHAPAMLPQLFAQLINLIGKIAPYLLGSGSFLAQGIIGSIALTMVNYYINIAGEGLKKTNDAVTEAANSIKNIVEIPAEQVIENAKEAIQYIQINHEKMTTDINNEKIKTQQKITIDLRLGIIYALMRKLENEKADLIKEGSGDGREFNELEEKYKELNEERYSLEEELNNIKEAEVGQKEAAPKRAKRGPEEGAKKGAKAQKIEAPATDNMNVAKEGDNIGGGTRKKRTSRKGKKKASKNRKTKARRARKSRKTKK